MSDTKEYTFPRGIGPDECKHFSEKMVIEIFPTPDQLVLPVLQHLGGDKNIQIDVKLRDTVVRGQQLTSCPDFMFAPIHSPVAGKVSKLSKVTLPNGRHVSAIQIDVDKNCPESDAQQIYKDCFQNDNDWCLPAELDDIDSLLKQVQAAGIVGMGGATFPTHIKLKRNEAKPIDTVLINGCECEPYLTADYRLMFDAIKPIATGAILSAYIAGAKKVIFCIEDNKMQAVRMMRERLNLPAFKQSYEHLGIETEVRVMRTKYPQGSEKQLIYAALRRKVPFPGLPLDVGVIVQNVSTAAAVAAMILNHQPLTHRIVTISGQGISSPKNLFVPFGTRYEDLIAFCGGYSVSNPPARIISGGPMMGFAIANLDTPVAKGTSGITLLSEDELRQSLETNCVRCGRCVGVCPMHLVPTKLAQASRAGKVGILEEYDVLACMECGCCAYICPASMPLVQLIRVGKGMVQKARAEAKKKAGA